MEEGGGLLEGQEHRENQKVPLDLTPQEPTDGEIEIENKFTTPKTIENKYTTPGAITTFPEITGVVEIVNEIINEIENE